MPAACPFRRLRTFVPHPALICQPAVDPAQADRCCLLIVFVPVGVGWLWACVPPRRYCRADSEAATAWHTAGGGTCLGAPAGQLASTLHCNTTAQSWRYSAASKQLTHVSKKCLEVFDNDPYEVEIKQVSLSSTYDANSPASSIIDGKDNDGIYDERQRPSTCGRTKAVSPEAAFSQIKAGTYSAPWALIDLGAVLTVDHLEIVGRHISHPDSYHQGFLKAILIGEAGSMSDSVCRGELSGPTSDPVHVHGGEVHRVECKTSATGKLSLLRGQYVRLVGGKGSLVLCEVRVWAVGSVDAVRRKAARVQTGPNAQPQSISYAGQFDWAEQKDQKLRISTNTDHKRVTGSCVTSDMRHVISAGNDWVIKWTNIVTGEVVLSVDMLSDPAWQTYGFKREPNGKVPNITYVYGGQNNQRTHSYPAVGSFTVACSPGGEYLAVGDSFGGYVRIAKQSNGEVVKTVLVGCDRAGLPAQQTTCRGYGRAHQTITTAPVYNLEFSPDSKHLASISAQQLKIHDVKTGQYLRTISFTKPRTCVKSSNNWCPSHWYYNYGSPPYGFHFSADGKSIVSLHHSRTYTYTTNDQGKKYLQHSAYSQVRVSDVASGREVRTIDVGHDSYVRRISVTADGKHVVALTHPVHWYGQRDHNQRLPHCTVSDFATGRYLRSVDVGTKRGPQKYEYGANVLDTTSDGAWIVTGSDKGNIVMSELATGLLKYTSLGGHWNCKSYGGYYGGGYGGGYGGYGRVASVTAVGCSPYIISTGCDHEIKLWFTGVTSSSSCPGFSSQFAPVLSPARLSGAHLVSCDRPGLLAQDGRQQWELTASKLRPFTSIRNVLTGMCLEQRVRSVDRDKREVAAALLLAPCSPHEVNQAWLPAPVDEMSGKYAKPRFSPRPSTPSEAYSTGETVQDGPGGGGSGGTCCRWEQPFLKSSGTERYALHLRPTTSLAISGDGLTIAVGESSTLDSGLQCTHDEGQRVHVYRYSGNALHYSAEFTGANDFGGVPLPNSAGANRPALQAVAVSHTGSVIAVGMPNAAGEQVAPPPCDVEAPPSAAFTDSAHDLVDDAIQQWAARNLGSDRCAAATSSASLKGRVFVYSTHERSTTSGQVGSAYSQVRIGIARFCVKNTLVAAFGMTREALCK